MIIPKIECWSATENCFETLYIFKWKSRYKNVPVKIAVELWRGSWGQDPFPENSWLIRNFPSSSESCGSLLYPTFDLISVVFDPFDDSVFVVSVFEVRFSVFLLIFLLVYVRHLGLKLLVPHTKRLLGSVWAKTRM